MDWLFTATPHADDERLAGLEDAERTLARWRRARRLWVELTASAGVLVWAAAGLGLPKRGVQTILFGVCGVVAASVAELERRARRRRERLAAQAGR